MRTRASVLRQAPGSFEPMELELEEPRQGELLVRMVASGLCHSDDHVAKGDMPSSHYPVCGGHEGAGIVEEVGPHTPGFSAGDHVLFSFVPACGRCRWCASGMSNLCDLGALLLDGTRFDGSGTFRLSLPDGTPVAQQAGLGTFSQFTTVSVDSALKIDDDLPLESMCLLGCGVGTGFGSAVHSAQVRPGDVTIVMGVGGIGINAIQGAAFAGAGTLIAVDPVAYKRESALEFGATHAFEDIAEATEFARSVTNGQGADSAIVTVGVVRGEHVGQAFAAIRKGGTVVVTAVGDVSEVGIPVPLGELTLFQKRIQGSLFGGSSPRVEIPRQIELYRKGHLKLDELITRTYTIDQVAEAYEDMHAGRNIRGIVRF